MRKREGHGERLCTVASEGSARTCVGVYFPRVHL